MPTGTREDPFILTQGTDFAIYTTVTLDSLGVDLSGRTLTANMRDRWQDTIVTANLTCTLSGSVTGRVDITLDGADSDAISTGLYVFDGEATTGNSRILLGRGYIRVQY